MKLGCRPADGVITLCRLPERRELSRTHFLLFELMTADGSLCSRNFSWLSTERDVIDQSRANWYMAPPAGFASFHALSDLPQATLELDREPPRLPAREIGGGDQELAFALRNTGNSLAFFTRLRLLTADGSEVLPAHFSDNYVSLLPGESLQLTVRDARLGQRGLAPPVEIEATGPRTGRVTLTLG